MIKATSAESSFFACDTEYYLPWCTLAVYDPFLWRDKSSLRHMAMNKLTVFVVYNICSKKWLCCQQKCCQGPEELLQMSKLSLFSRYQRCCSDNSGEVHPFLRTLPVRRLNSYLSQTVPVFLSWGSLSFTWHICDLPLFCEPQGHNRRKQVSWESIYLSSSSCCLQEVP